MYMLKEMYEKTEGTVNAQYEAIETDDKEGEEMNKREAKLTENAA